MPRYALETIILILLLLWLLGAFVVPLGSNLVHLLLVIVLVVVVLRLVQGRRVL
ncbi:MAG TPA: lmo0937 family membrane protein [Urbifossiella sp.]|nr:lmo0937 family membrane protein [Urbifossiella sp.]